SLAGWTRGERVDGKRVAWAAAQAVLEVPLASAGGASPAVWLRLKSAGKQSLRIGAGGKLSAPVPVAPGWQTLKVPLPEGALHAGENELHLTFGAGGKKAAAIEWLQVGGEEPPPDALAPTLGTATGLALPADFYIYLPKDARLEGEGGGAP